ncbi:Asp-tRNA(Asn)/Glu-tRNA(Gln) amidotransferase subunit GatA [Mycoplasma sp. NEAQ87857]|uniref:amidase family protein n=1 Tax=Mycoplasma sp. NEAQ87857 TaxID=2683967 RepID=UPI001318F3D6|nr:amidase family protein [Mycoplasma sp. NEAQ87857]QGZ97300.1 Asp-tRNA(Asn)/Glu-tRNA(Gln) amidotransferase subunit GatA [Mycoplasma sp. NEAQ87857]
MNREFLNKGDCNLAYNELKNDQNNCVASMMEIKEAKKGALNNVALTIKDVFATKDYLTRASSLILDNFYPSYNATVVDKLINNGAVALAKVNNDELALGGTGTYSAYGLITNPLDKTKYAGGSSSGSVATFSKNVGIALGSDTGDSVRLPASYCGVVGFKPSYGAISRYGMFAYASSLDTVAYFTHNVNDAIVVAQNVYGLDNKDMTTVEVEINNVIKTKPNKVILLDFSEFCEAYVNDAIDQLIAKMQEKDIKVEIIKPNLDILRTIKPVYQVISFSEASSNLANLNGVAFGNRQEGDSWEQLMHSTRSKGFGKMVQERLSLGSYFLYSENQEELFIKAQKARRVIKNYLNELHDKADVVIYPAFGGIAPTFGSEKDYDVMNYILTGANLAGNPSITIPLAKYQNFPFNLAIDAANYKDAQLLANAEYIEELIGEMYE